MAVTDSADIAIVGGGPVGAALGLALESTGLDVLILEARSNDALTSSDADGRPLGHPDNHPVFAAAQDLDEE